MNDIIWPKDELEGLSDEDRKLLRGYAARLVAESPELQTILVEHKVLFDAIMRAPAAMGFREQVYKDSKTFLEKLKSKEWQSQSEEWRLKSKKE